MNILKKQFPNQSWNHTITIFLILFSSSLTISIYQYNIWQDSTETWPYAWQGFNHWLDKIIQDGKTLDWVEEQIKNSEEYKNKISQP